MLIISQDYSIINSLKCFQYAFIIFLENTHNDVLHIFCNDTNNALYNLVQNEIWDNMRLYNIGLMKSS